MKVRVERPEHAEAWPTLHCAVTGKPLAKFKAPEPYVSDITTVDGLTITVADYQTGACQWVKLHKTPSSFDEAVSLVRNHYTRFPQCKPPKGVPL